MKKKIVCVGMVCVVLLGILCGCGSGGTASGGGCKTSDELIKIIATAMYKDKDASRIYDLVYEERQAIIEEKAKEHSIYGKDEIIAQYQSDIDDHLNEIDEEIGEGWKYSSYKITSEIDYIEGAEDENYDILKFNHRYRHDGMEDFTAEEGKTICLQASFKTSDGETAMYTDESTGESGTFAAWWTYTLAKIDGKWYLIDFWSPYWLES